MTAPEIFLTGFPGFLGSAVLERVLARGDGPVACLVQPHYRDLADRRARVITENAGVERSAVRIHEGDVTDSDLGLDGVETLESVDELYHFAAVYDLGVEPELAHEVNVRGTEHVLEFAETVGVECVHHVSTCYVSGRYDGVFTGDHLEEGQSFSNHYEETKYRAEVAVRERMAGGLPATIYRPAIVVGDSETGETDKYDGPYYLLWLLLAQPRWLSVVFSLPDSSSAELNVVPRDYVVDAITYLSALEESAGGTYQLCDPAPLTVPRFLEVLAEAAGRRTVTLPTTRSLAKTATAWLAARGGPAEPATVDYLDHPTQYACPNTRRALAGSGLECPPVESYVDRLVAFARENPEVGDGPMV